jgi:hypothetical protein
MDGSIRDLMIRPKQCVNHSTQQAHLHSRAHRPAVSPLLVLAALHPRRRLPPSAAARTCQRVSS